MGICLDTEANIAAQEADDPRSDWKGGGQQNTSAGPIRTPPDGNFPMQNIGKIKFDPPKVPVIFVLGGPGSGKVTHCDTLMQEKRGVTHINMMDLLQQYAIGNDMQDFSQLSSKTVTEVLMLEMKMAPAAKAYLVSGYPRSMRDVVEYSEKIQVVNGVILISWRQAVLQKQIDYGAKLGHVVLSLAKMELENFFKNVMPVADYFDQSDMLIAVNGERSPNEVYKDFRGGILDILGAQDNQEALLNGVAGMGRGIDEIPGSIVSVETAPSQTKPTITENLNNKNDVRTTTATTTASITNIGSVGGGGGGGGVGIMMRPTSHNKSIQQLNPNSLMGQNVVTASLLSNNYQGHPQQLQQQQQQQQQRPISNSIVDNLKVPPVIFVIGGPGSNKANLCLKIVNTNPSWSHFSIGRLLRTIAESQPKPNTENYFVKESIINGEMVTKKIVDRLIETQLKLSLNKKGVIIDGYPRDMEQVKYFQNKYNQKSQIILLDCSKLQLGRGRLDDTVSSFRRRLELFRELTLPMLKQMDADGRLTIVDGDTDSTSVQRDFERIINKHMQSYDNINNKDIINNDNINNKINNYPIVQDLDDDMPGRVPTISHHVSLSNGHLTNNHNNNNNNHNNNIQLINGGIKNINNNNNNINKNNNIQQQQQNGHIGNGRTSLKNMLEDAEKYSIDAHI